MTVRYDAARRELVLAVRNGGAAAADLTIKANAYFAHDSWNLEVARGANAKHRWSTEASHGWYDFTVTRSDGTFAHRFAGRMETGEPSTSDPAMGNA